MTKDQLQPSREILETSELLLDRDISDVYGFLGIQAERLEIARSRLDGGRAIPEWSDADAFAKVLSDQRASLEDLKKYVAKGKTFVEKLLKQVEPNLRELLCKGRKVRPELEGLESDTKELLKYVSTGMVGLIAANLPAGIAGAAASIATVLAVVVIKNKITTFCQSGGKTGKRRKK
jgi:hypothetical protein